MIPSDPERPRTILHVDLDAFFAAVEVREDPRLAGKPVVVGADPRGGRGRGVVAAASYEARAYGIHSAMPISQAYRRCPQAVYLRPRIGLYVAVSERFEAILGRYTDLVEPLSIDEAFLDVTGSRRLFGDGATIARCIKDEVCREERLTASVGVAPCKFVAKIASDLKKPDGLVVVPPDGVTAFLEDLPVHRLWGAGVKAVARFGHLGVRTVGEVARLPPAVLTQAFGAALGEHFHALARGIDPRSVEPEQVRKSLGRETTFDTDVQDREAVARALLDLVDQVAQRLRAQGLAGRTVTVKLRSADFVTVSRQEALPVSTDTAEVIWPVARRLLAKADVTQQAIRLVGVAVSDFADAGQLALFDAGAAKGRRIAQAVDAVVARFGEDAITRAALLGARRPRRTGPGGG
jgi:nucleotidyltransferase/DNA polymerase involved in DNA repair